MATSSYEQFERVSVVLRALASPIRVAIVELLSIHHRLHVHEIVDGIGTTQALTSQHLRVLRHAQLVVREQDGRQVSYRLRNPDLVAVVTAVVTFCESQY